jgi:predicted nucleic acid-binding protein
MASTPAIQEGEASIVAVAFHNAEIIPVLIDRRGIWRAVEELRGRVIGVYAILDVLRRNHHLDSTVAGRLAATFQGRHSMSPPMWWT